ncbi:MucR family transcriptional regulator [Roseixanthobacter pseudopolyaromaticivorans]|uniref:MucR family transcriptional regulator n=1 Tax=Xanthobacter sp. VTT E-85239 TaxID=3119919 RepID=UPI0037359721
MAVSAALVAAYVSNNSVPTAELPKLIDDIHAALRSLGAAVPIEAVKKPEPAVPVRKSVTADFIICLEDGKKFKSLKRHIRTQYGLTPAEYRQKWNLPADYPMVAPSYAESRSALAKVSGLGQLRKAAAPAPDPIVEAAPAVAEKPKHASRIKASAPIAVVAAPETAPSKRAPRKAKAVAEPVVEPAARPKRTRKAAATTDS